MIIFSSKIKTRLTNYSNLLTTYLSCQATCIPRTIIIDDYTLGFGTELSSCCTTNNCNNGGIIKPGNVNYNGGGSNRAASLFHVLNFTR